MRRATTRRPTTILVIDDEPDARTVLTHQLERWGYRTLAATSGEAGLEIADAERPDLILLDILMPRMKGRQVCAHLKTNPRTQAIPVIFLTALGMPRQIKAGLDLGADDYIIKPVEPEELRDRIHVRLLRAGRR